MSGALRINFASYGGGRAVGAPPKEDIILFGCVGGLNEADRGEEEEDEVHGDEDVTSTMKELYGTLCLDDAKIKVVGQTE